MTARTHDALRGARTVAYVPDMQEPVEDLKSRPGAATHDGVAACRWSKEMRDAYVASLVQTGGLSPEESGWLVLRAPNGHVSSLRIKERSIVGRGPEAHIRLGHPEISRKHCILNPDGDTVIVEDAGSMHGTLINGAPLLGRHRMLTGDILTIGPWLLVWI